MANFVLMFNARKLLFPFSLLYGSVMLLRNKLYDYRIFRSKSFDLPVIAVGNLSMGGTGKSPMIEYLVELLRHDYRVATLSRGYKRSSRGFKLLTGNESAGEVGDEPLQFKKKFPEIIVAVDEKRTHGIEQLLGRQNQPQVVLLDDAFQHRQVEAGFYILLTDYNKLYTKDLVLPAGNLREPGGGAKRADVIVVTKCPPDLDAVAMEKIRDELSPEEGQEVFFSSIGYPEEVLGNEEAKSFEELRKTFFSLVTGIADPGPLVKFLRSKNLKFDHVVFPDHHNFSRRELLQLKELKLIITTEKDYMRLKDEIPEKKLFYLPIQARFLSKQDEFDAQIRNFVQKK